MSQKEFRGAVPIVSGERAAAAAEMDRRRGYVLVACREPIKPGCTHIIIQIPSNDEEYLYDAEGMVFGNRLGERVTFGYEPKEPGNRMFMNPDCAAKWFRKLASMQIVSKRAGGLNLADAIDDGESAEVVFDVRNAEETVLQGSVYRN